MGDDGKEMVQTEIQDLKDDVKEIKGDVKEVVAGFNSLRILIAENYVTRKEFDEFRKAEQNSRRWWAGFVIGASGVVVGVLTLLSRFLGSTKGGG